ncbi:hypothetical protein A9Q99_22725 [Gammaproteobacteria bacterium 45_16_T64]|nr:hypothetical protein A9Q99_22725 [Gammaproteobacteria bacterium 45_16_T64]
MKLDEEFFQELLLEADKSERKRAHHNIHKELDEPVQRLCIALKKGTYVTPHHHSQDNKWELIVCIKGGLGLVVFDENGLVIDKITLSPGGSTAGIELIPNTWHTVYPITEDVVILEVKEGPYTPAKKNDFAQWAPQEGDSNTEEFLTWIQRAKIGDAYGDE